MGPEGYLRYSYENVYVDLVLMKGHGNIQFWYAPMASLAVEEGGGTSMGTPCMHIFNCLGALGRDSVVEVSVTVVLLLHCIHVLQATCVPNDGCITYVYYITHSNENFTLF